MGWNKRLEQEKYSEVKKTLKDLRRKYLKKKVLLKEEIKFQDRSGAVKIKNTDTYQIAIQTNTWLKNDLILYQFDVVIDFVNIKPNLINLISYDKEKLNEAKAKIKGYVKFVDIF